MCSAGQARRPRRFRLYRFCRPLSIERRPAQPGDGIRPAALPEFRRCTEPPIFAGVAVLSRAAEGDLRAAWGQKIPSARCGAARRRAALYGPPGGKKSPALRRAPRPQAARCAPGQKNSPHPAGRNKKAARPKTAGRTKKPRAPGTAGGPGKRRDRENVPIRQVSRTLSPTEGGREECSAAAGPGPIFPCVGGA